MVIINNFMVKKKVNKDLQFKIREYLDYYWNQTETDNKEKENEIIELLSEPLKKSLLIDVNKIILHDSIIFSKNFSEKVIDETVHLVTEVSYVPDEVLYEIGDE